MAKPNKEEMLDKAWGTLDGVVWALLAQGVPYPQIVERTAQARDEWLPLDRPAFTTDPDDASRRA